MTLPATPRLLRINEVAAETGLTTRAIRYYEEVGLLEPAARSDGDYRLYDASDLERLAFIRSLRDDAGFSLAQIGQLLEDDRARERNRERFRQTGDPDERRALILESTRGSTIRSRSSRPRPPASQDDRRGARPATPPRGAPRRARQRPCRRIRCPRHDRGAPSSTRAAWPTPIGLSPFRHRNFRLFFGGQMISLIGTWMQQVAQAWLVLELTHDPIWLGIVAAAQFMPVVIFGLFAASPPTRSPSDGSCSGPRSR